MASDIVLFDDTIADWKQAFYAFLAEKERRSGRKLLGQRWSPYSRRCTDTAYTPPENHGSQSQVAQRSARARPAIVASSS